MFSVIYIQSYSQILSLLFNQKLTITYTYIIIFSSLQYKLYNTSIYIKLYNT